jgi:hypothetical protein
MTYLRASDLGQLTVEQVSANRNLPVGRFGVTTGCFTTRGASIEVAYAQGSPTNDASVLQQIASAAGQFQQSNLTQDEVTFILTEKARAQRLLSDMLDQASTTKSAWEDALAKVNAWGECKASWTTISCSSEQDAYNQSYDNAYAQMMNLAQQRLEAFRAVDVLMIFAQTPADAQALCAAKMRAYGKLQQVVNEIAPLAQKIASVEDQARAAWANTVNGLLAALQAFMALLGALIDVIKNVFQGLVAAAGFFAGTLAPFIAANPNVVLYGALGVVALGAGGFAFLKIRQLLRS